MCLNVERRASTMRAWMGNVASLGLCCGLLFASGCGEKLSLVPVTGSVTLDGQPVADAGVLFQPIERGPAASGTTDALGKFTLQTANRPGAAPTAYRVVITKTAAPEMVMEERDAIDRSRLGQGTVKPDVHFLPAVYASADTSPLRAEVDVAGSNFTYSLSSAESTSANSPDGASSEGSPPDAATDAPAEKSAAPDTDDSAADDSAADAKEP